MEPIESSEDVMAEMKRLARRVQELEAVKAGLEDVLAELRHPNEGNFPPAPSAEEQLRSEKLLSLEQLCAGASSEIINPLNAIGINIQLLLRYESLKPSSRQLCNIMMEEVERIREVLEGLETFARQIKTELQLVSIQSALSQALHFVDERIKRHGIEVVEEYLDSPPVVKGDSLLLEQAFKKILDNAVEAMPKKGTLTLKIAEAARDETSVVNVQITDTGPGISRKHIRRVFDPFFTTREIGQNRGLGLSIALGIVKSHGGTISVDSVEKVGTTFTVELPLERHLGTGEPPQGPRSA